VPRGGPNGGDGGKGGDVIIVGQKKLLSLLDFKYKSIYKAQNGTVGGGSGRTGRNGKDVFVRVPVGTVVYDAATQDLLVDVVEDGQTYIVAYGGRGGRGNAKFVSPVHRAPTEYEDGKKGEERALKLELKLLATMGIIGLPNAGKSTLLSRLTAATPEIADYPFTTLSPSLGVLSGDDHSLVLADIPGIIEGASSGRGLGLQFLRHIERTRTLLWVIDVSSVDPVKDYMTLRNELQLYNAELPGRQRIIVLNKVDLIDESAVRKVVSRFRERGEDVVAVSAALDQGIDRLKDLMRETEGQRAHG
jgi:GTPase